MPVSHKFIDDPCALVGPLYTIRQYTDQIYHIVKFKNQTVFLVGPPSANQHHDAKLDSSLSRTRRTVLEYALCNEWSYFCTFTLDKSKYDRFDLLAFKKDFSQWLRDYRKSHPDLYIKFLLVPEQHKDGAWHMHGLFTDIKPVLESFDDAFFRGEDVPFSLVGKNFFNWPDYQKKFGFCSLSPIRDRVACGFYITKYVTKSVSDTKDFLGKHALLVSRGLMRSVVHGHVYQESSFLDQFLDKDFEFVRTGMTRVDHGLDWSFAFNLMEETSGCCSSFLFENCEVTYTEVDEYYEAVQMALDGF